MHDKAEIDVGKPRADVEAVRWWLSAVVATGYGGFLVIAWLAGPALAQPGPGDVPWSFYLGTGLLGSIVAIMGGYVLMANRQENP